VTKAEAMRRADKLAKRTGKIQFVVWELPEGFQVASEFDLDTWFAGIADRNIVYCTADADRYGVA